MEDPSGRYGIAEHVSEPVGSHADAVVDEGVLPSTSRMNPTRMYMPDKPHKWGTKLFMTCDAATSYCFRYVFLVIYTCCIIPRVCYLFLTCCRCLTLIFMYVVDLRYTSERNSMTVIDQHSTIRQEQLMSSGICPKFKMVMMALRRDHRPLLHRHPSDDSTSVDEILRSWNYNDKSNRVL